MIYFSEFRNINNNLLSVEIITNDDISTRKELTLTDVSITSESNGIFSPIKAESATIGILTNELYSDMYASKNLSTKVTIKDVNRNNVLFHGYLTPNIYDLDYVGLDNLQLEAVCGISALKNIKYKQTSTIINWYKLIKDALTKVGYDKFIMSDSYSVNEIPLVKSLYQFEGNFFDDDDEKTAWTYYDILEEFCKYFCLSLVVHQDTVYFLDYSNLKTFKVYNLINDSVSDSTLNRTFLITAEAYKNTGASISYDETFNKVAVKDNLYNLNYEHNPIEDEDLVNLNADPNKYYLNTKKVDKEDYTYLNGFFDNEKYHSKHEVEVTPANIETLNNAVFWLKVAEYKSDEEPSSLNWDTYLSVCNDGKYPEASYGVPARWIYNFILPKEKVDAICNGGYFLINLDYKLSESPYANDCFKSKGYKYEDKTYNTGLHDDTFACRLLIGDYFYNGTKWSNYLEYNRKLAKGYYREVSYMGVDSPRNYYKYKDADGDWAFCKDKAEYDALPEGTIKETGSAAIHQNSHLAMFYWWEGTKPGDYGVRIYIDKDYYNECILRDRFYLVHKNKYNDTIFDTIRKLDNTASWKMNIDDSEDGVAIPLPDFVLSGKLNFTIQVPDFLGTYAQDRVGNVEKAPVVKAIHINRCNLIYKSSGSTVDLFNLNKAEDDVIFTNEINEDYVNEWDDLELKINTLQKDKISSFSSVLYKTTNNKFSFITNVTDKINNISRMLEETIIDRYYNHYNSPKLILNASLINRISPIMKIKELNLNKEFILDSYELDLINDSINAKLIEL